MPASPLDDVQTIARPNDRVRQGLDRTTRITMTANLLGQLSNGAPEGQLYAQAAALRSVKSCIFSEDSPERDMAFIDINGVRAYFRIDYYDLQLRYGSDDPANPEVTCRVLTIMAPEDMKKLVVMPLLATT